MGQKLLAQAREEVLKFGGSSGWASAQRGTTGDIERKGTFSVTGLQREVGVWRQTVGRRTMETVSQIRKPQAPLRVQELYRSS